MATKKATKKKAPAKAAITHDVTGVSQMLGVRLYNITNKVMHWKISGGGSKHRGNTPGMTSSVVRMYFAKSYRVTMWSDAEKKHSARCPPHGSAIFTGRKIAVTTPH